jgi:hypothetical protein
MFVRSRPSPLPLDDLTQLATIGSTTKSIARPSAVRVSGARRRTPVFLRAKRTVLVERSAMYDDIDKHTIATMCFGRNFAAFYRGSSKKKNAEPVVAVLPPGIASKRPTRGKAWSAH